MRRNLFALALLVVFAAGVGLGACGGSDAKLPSKDKTFTKMRGANTGAEDGEDVPMGECSAEEKAIPGAACYGDVLLHCSSDGEVHGVDCAKVKNAAVTMHKCVEDEKTADCK